MCSLNGLHVEVDGAVGGAADGGISAVGEGAGLPVAETCNIVLVAAEVLVLSCFELEGAELLVDDLPDNLVGGHVADCRALCGFGRARFYSGRSGSYFGCDQRGGSNSMDMGRCLHLKISEKFRTKPILPGGELWPGPQVETADVGLVCTLRAPAGPTPRTEYQQFY